MKKIILIGKLNATTKEISDWISPYGQVQLCSDNADVIQGMLKLIAPDLVLFALAGSAMLHKDILVHLFHQCPDTPVLIIGSQYNSRELGSIGLLKEERLCFLARPVGRDELCEHVQELLKVKDKKQVVQTTTSSRKTILVVDDNPLLLRTMQSMLSKKYRVTFATSGPQAIAAIAKDRPDLILLDYEMPVCDGKMTLQLLRAEEATRDIPVVFLTGLADSDHVMEVLALQPQGYLLKPPSESKIFTTIEQALKESAKKNQG